MMNGKSNADPNSQARSLSEFERWRLIKSLEKKAKDPGLSDANRQKLAMSAQILRRVQGRINRQEMLRNQQGAVLDPELLQHGITIAGFHIEAGTRKFAEFRQAMVDDLGEEIRPYLKMLYNAIRDYPGFDNTGMTPRDKMDA